MPLVIASLLAAMSLASAIPTQQLQDRAEPDYSYILDPWAELKENSQDASKLLKRDSPILNEILRRATDPQNTEAFKGFIPGCDVDPSTSDKNTEYQVDQGVKIPKSGKDDECTTGHNSDHCWTEYYLVEAAIEYIGWRNTAAAIDCATTSSCSSSAIDLNQTCTLTGTSTTNGYDWKIIDASLSLDYEKKPFTGGLGIGAGVTKTHSTTENDLTNSCVGSSANQVCTWDDKACHQVWFADRVLHVWGQSERVCNGDTKGDVQQHSQRVDGGKWVRGQHGFDFRMPVNKLVGCGAVCGDQEYKSQLPANEERSPYIKPAGW